MDLLKRVTLPTLIILAASAIVVFAFWPLENSEFAEGFRSGEMVEGDGGSEGFGAEGEAAPPAGGIGIAIYFLPMVKVAVLMGIGVFFTWVGRRIGRLFTRRKIPEPAG